MAVGLDTQRFYLEACNSSSDEDYDTFSFVPQVVLLPKCGTQTVVGEDDGWMSGSELEDFAPKLGTPDQHDEQFFSQFPKPYMYYDDEVWVDEAKAIFSASMKENPEKMSEALREMFNAHKDVYSLLVTFFQRAGRTRDKALSLRRVVTMEFSTWLCEQKAIGSSLQTVKLTAQHQKEALTILTYCHPIYMDDICLLFDLKSAAIEDQLALIRDLLADLKHKVAVTYVWKFRLQEHFSMREMLLPLVDLDKINMIENYIGDSRKLQEEFVSLVDRLCEPGANFESLCPEDFASSKVERADNSKLNLKQLYKMGIRFVIKYNLELDKFPNLSQKKASASLHYLLCRVYVENSTITAENGDDLIKAAVRGKLKLQTQLISELTGHFNNLPAAAYWSRELGISTEYLPCSLRNYLDDPTAAVVQEHTEVLPHQEKGHFFELSLPLSKVLFVDGYCSLQNCWKRLTQPGSVIGIDAEWCLSACNGGIERVALLQLAVQDAVFLLDISNLQQRIQQETLKQFFVDIFASHNLLKLGYGVAGDLSMLAKTWPFAAEPLTHHKRVVELQTFSKMVGKLLKHQEELNLKSKEVSTHSITELPSHPLSAITTHNQQQQQSSFTKPNIPFTPVTKRLKDLSPASQVQPAIKVAKPRVSHSGGSSATACGLTTGLTLKERYLRALEELHNSSNNSSATPSPVNLEESTSQQAMSLQPPVESTSESVPCKTQLGSHTSSKENLSSTTEEPESLCLKGGGGVVRGLSLLVRECLGKPLDKAQQFSDWQRRPLHEEQVKYAALDAYCLLAVYEKLRSQALAVDAHFNLEPTLHGAKK